MCHLRHVTKVRQRLTCVTQNMITMMLARLLSRSLATVGLYSISFSSQSTMSHLVCDSFLSPVVHFTWRKVKTTMVSERFRLCVNEAEGIDEHHIVRVACQLWRPEATRNEPYLQNQSLHADEAVIHFDIHENYTYKSNPEPEFKVLNLATLHTSNGSIPDCSIGNSTRPVSLKFISHGLTTQNHSK